MSSLPFPPCLANWYRQKDLLGLLGLRNVAGQPAGSGALGAWAGSTSGRGRVQEPTEAWWHHPGLLDNRPRPGQ